MPSSRLMPFIERPCFQRVSICPLTASGIGGRLTRGGCKDAVTSRKRRDVFLTGTSARARALSPTTTIGSELAKRVGTSSIAGPSDRAGSWSSSAEVPPSPGLGTFLTSASAVAQPRRGRGEAALDQGLRLVTASLPSPLDG